MIKVTYNIPSLPKHLTEALELKYVTRSESYLGMRCHAKRMLSGEATETVDGQAITWTNDGQAITWTNDNGTVTATVID